jgi:hypothetical protein
MLTERWSSSIWTLMVLLGVMGPTIAVADFAWRCCCEYKTCTETCCQDEVHGGPASHEYVRFVSNVQLGSCKLDWTPDDWECDNMERREVKCVNLNDLVNAYETLAKCQAKEDVFFRTCRDNDGCGCSGCRQVGDGNGTSTPCPE